MKSDILALANRMQQSAQDARNAANEYANMGDWVTAGVWDAIAKVRFDEAYAALKLVGGWK
jgi:hypothetical protein